MELSVQHSSMSLPNQPLQILAFEGWDAGSHSQVRHAISQYSRHDWHWVTKPGRAWKWRLRTGAVDLLADASHRGLLKVRPNLIFATSMVSVGDLRSLLPTGMRDVPIIIYMHENQAAYPFRHATHMEKERDYQFALTNLTSCLSADRVLWNSAWNRDSFLDGIDGLLGKSPEKTCADACRCIMGKSEICWPPVDHPDAVNGQVLHNRPGLDNSGPLVSGAQAGSTVKEARGDHVRIVWPHRWEHDKGPDTLLRLASFLRHRQPGRYRWTLLGEQFRAIPESLERFQSEFKDDIDHAGWVESREAYWSHLREADWVLSTARHEFFGIAVVEAMLAGCLPWLPRRLSYPEILPAQARELCPSRPIKDEADVRKAMSKHLMAASPGVAVDTIDSQIEDHASSNPAC